MFLANFQCGKTAWERLPGVGLVGEGNGLNSELGEVGRGVFCGLVRVAVIRISKGLEYAVGEIQGFLCYLLPMANVPVKAGSAGALLFLCHIVAVGFILDLDLEATVISGVLGYPIIKISMNAK